MASSTALSSVLILLLLPLLSHAATFNIYNNCGYTVCPASLNPSGGTQLSPGQTWSLNVPAGSTSGRVWGRTGCSFDGNGNGHCSTGDCNGVLHCTLSGTPPTTLAEYSLNQGGNDYYDISVIDGFNVPMEFKPTNGNCHDIVCKDSSCPDAYHQPNDVKTYSCPSGTDYRITFCP